jgi:hypothetical protein
MARRRSYAQRRLRTALRRFAVDARWPLLGATLTLVVLIAVEYALQMPRFLFGLIVGALVSGLGWYFWLIFLMSSGNVFLLAGIWGEKFADEELRKARKRGLVYGHLNNIEIGGFDIDHLAVAPGGVLAFETKAHMVQLDDARLRGDISQAVAAARKASLVLRSRHVKIPHDVTPVLLLWGRRNTSALPTHGVLIDGVRVLAVADLSNWLKDHQTGEVSRAEAGQILARLTAFRLTQEPGKQGPALAAHGVTELSAQSGRET